MFTLFSGSLPPVTFDLWFQKLISTTNPTTFVTKNGWNSLHWFLRYGVHKVFGMHRLTHRRTDPNAVSLRHRFSTVAETYKSACTWPVSKQWTESSLICWLLKDAKFLPQRGMAKDLRTDAHLSTWNFVNANHSKRVTGIAYWQRTDITGLQTPPVSRRAYRDSDMSNPPGDVHEWEPQPRCVPSDN